MIDADYKALEERAAAGGIAGKDIHAELACEVYGVTPEQVTSAMRRSAKSINYFRLYHKPEVTTHGDAREGNGSHDPCVDR